MARDSNHITSKIPTGSVSTKQQQNKGATTNSRLPFVQKQKRRVPAPTEGLQQTHTSRQEVQPRSIVTLTANSKVLEKAALAGWGDPPTHANTGVLGLSCSGRVFFTPCQLTQPFILLC